MHHPNYDSQNIHLHLMDDSVSHSSVFPISNPQNQKPDHPLYQFQGTKPPGQIFRPPANDFTYLLSHQQEAERFHQQQGQQLSHQHPFSTVNFMGLKEIGAAAEDSGDFNRQHSVLVPGCWNSQENPAIKEPFWRNQNQRSEDKECGTEDKRGGIEFSRCRVFGELEAIWNLAKFSEVNQAAASTSALTENKNSTQKTGFSRMLTDVIQCPNGGEETSIGEEAILRKIQKKKRRKMKMEEELSSIADFFQNLVKTVIDHQEFLHKKIIEAIERLDKDRTQKEESWRCLETEKHNKEILAREQEQVMASKRDALIVSQLERITGQSINFPSRNDQSGSIVTNCRWPRAEVEALIETRRSLESKFEEPKGRIWEEVSSAMASKGYIRSAKKCKEKWENMNKYFRKSKEGGIKRSLKSKTCSYFDQLDQINSSKFPGGDIVSESQRQGDDSEFLAAFLAPFQGFEGGNRGKEKESYNDDDNGD